MRARVIEQIERTGGSVTPDDHIRWREGTWLQLTVQVNGRAELRVPGRGLDAPSPRPEDLLRANPECGWSWVVDREGVSRRLVVGPAVWAQPALLTAEVDRLVVGAPPPVQAKHRLRVLPVRDDAFEAPTRALCDAVALYCLVADGLARDGSRHVLASGDALDVVLVGDSGPKLRLRAQQEMLVIQALALRPEVAPGLLAAWGFPAETPERAGKGESPR